MWPHTKFYVSTHKILCGQKARKHKGFQAFLPHKQFYVVTYKILCDHIKKIMWSNNSKTQTLTRFFTTQNSHIIHIKFHKIHKISYFGPIKKHRKSHGNMNILEMSATTYSDDCIGAFL